MPTPIINRESSASGAVRFVGEARHGYRTSNTRKRVLVPKGTNGFLFKRAKDHCGHLVEFIIDKKVVRLYAPSWELRRLVKR